MKKLTFLLVGLFISTTLFAQTCVEDAWQCLRQNQAPKAKKFIDNCMEAYPDNAQVWLMKANVYLQLYNMDQKKLAADPNATPRYPDAINVANEAFIKALQLDPTVKPKTGMLGATEGQRLCAQPFYDKGVAALEKGDETKALENFAIAAKNFELGKSAHNAALSYFQTAIIYLSKDKKEDAIAALTKAIHCKKDFSDLYVELYWLYQGLNDTTNCAKVIDDAMANIPVTEMDTIAEMRMNYYSTTDQGDQLLALCDTVLAHNPGDVKWITICSNYLSNYKSFEKAETILSEALKTNPDKFELNEQMGYRFYQEMQSVEDRIVQLQKEKKWQESIDLRNSPELKALTEKAFDWCNKAYKIFSDNIDNNKRLRQLYVKLGKAAEIPQELNDKINARQHN